MDNVTPARIMFKRSTKTKTRKYLSNFFLELKELRAQPFVSIKLTFALFPQLLQLHGMHHNTLQIFTNLQFQRIPIKRSFFWTL